MTFQDCLLICCQNTQLITEFNRLTGCTLSFRDGRKPIEIMIDNATGYNNPFKNKPEEMQRFITFCFEFVWLTLVTTGTDDMAASPTEGIAGIENERP